MSVILLGYRGSGKSTIGRKLADRLWQKFVDTDDLIVAVAGKSIREIFEQDGEARFRDLEVAAVLEACSKIDHVVALGGGAVLREENRQLLLALSRSRIYLRCEPAELFRRIQSDPSTAQNRPSLTKLGGTVEEIQQMLQIREPLYHLVMSSELDVTNLSVQDAMIHITKMM